MVGRAGARRSRPRLRITSTGVPYSSLSTSQRSTSSGVPIAEPPVGEVQDAVDHAEHRVDVVGDEDHRRVVLAPPPVDQLADPALVLRGRGSSSGSSQSSRTGSSASAWPTRSRCCSPPDRVPTGAVGVARSRPRRRAASSTRAFVARGADRQAEAVAVDAERRRGRGRAAACRRRRASAAGCSRCGGRRGCTGIPSTLIVPAVELLLPEDGPQQARLARAVRAEHGEELARAAPSRSRSCHSVRPPKPSVALVEISRTSPGTSCSTARDRASTVASRHPREVVLPVGQGLGEVDAPARRILCRGHAPARSRRSLVCSL